MSDRRDASRPLRSELSEERTGSEASAASKPPSDERPGSSVSDNADPKPTKRTRGRPSKDPSGDRALDQRRARVREATRALRARKEAEVRALRERNLALESAVDRMNSMFIDFSDTLLDSETILEDAVTAHRLKQVTKSFLSVARETSKGRQMDMDSNGEDIEDVDEGIEAVTGSSFSLLRHLSVSETIEQAKGRSSRRPDLGNQSRFSRSYGAPEFQECKTPCRDFRLLNDPLADTALTQQLELHPGLVGENVTFQTMLLRDNLTIAWNCLRGVSSSSLTLAKSMFRYALLHRSITELLTGIRWSLLVGSGLDIYANQYGEAEDPTQNLVAAIEDTLQLRGQTESDYINYNNVEDYLRKKGAFYIDSSRIKLLIPTLSRKEDNVQSNSENLRSPIAMESSPGTTNEQTQNAPVREDPIRDWQLDPALLGPSLPGSAPELEETPISEKQRRFHEMPFLSTSYTIMNTSHAMDSENWRTWKPQISPFQVVTLNASILVKNLILMSLCLGRGPAYAPANVDRAIEAARIENVY